MGSLYVDSPDRRGITVRLLERLISRVLATGDPLMYSADISRQAPEVEAALEEYVDHANVRALTAVPLKTPGHDEDAPRRKAYQGANQ